jgi:isopenicillin N synthase-like dioxygenase
MVSFPVIDVAALFGHEPEPRRRIGRALYHAHSTIGFSLLVNAPPTCMIDDVLSIARRFHARPLAEKLRMKYRASLRGFLPLNTSTLVDSTLGSARMPNQSESFMVLNELAQPQAARWGRSIFGGAQVWPDEPAGFRAVMSHYQAALESLAIELIRCFASELGAPPGYLDAYFDYPNTFLRLLHYPAIPERADDVYGSAPHTDYGCLTLLVQDDTGGLQVQLDDASWLDVPCMNHAFVLNTGQMMQLWSAGRIKPTPHRVLNATHRARDSVAFFYNCALDARVEALPFTGASDDPQWRAQASARAKSVIYGEHLEKILHANYSFSKE